MRPGDVTPLAAGLEEQEPGLWAVRGSSRVSYPFEATSEYRSIEDRSFWFRHRNRVVVELVRRFPPPGLIVDVGAGNGVVSAALREAGFSGIVVEPNPEGARNARRRGLTPVICGTLESVKVREGSLPAVGLFDVLEHIPDDIAYLSELHRLLHPRGRVYISVPAYNALRSSEDDYVGHYRRYTARSLRRALAAAGFEVEFSGYMFSLLPPAILALRTLPSRLGRRPTRSLAADHVPGGPRVSRLLERLLGFEVTAIRRGLALPFGASCVAVALKPGQG